MTYAAQARFGDYSPVSFGWGTRDPELNGALLRDFVYGGANFGSMHVDAHGLFTALLDELVPLIGGTPNPVNGECGCFNPNSVTVGGDRSFHTYGIAIDVNWTQNPMYAAAHPTGPHTLPLATSGIARKYGCEWGGDWTYPQDWMHLEIHLTPDVARGVRPLTSPAVPAPRQEDDMGVPVTVTKSTFPNHPDRFWLYGPKGRTEISKNQAGAVCDALGVPLNNASEASVAEAQAVLVKVLG